MARSESATNGLPRIEGYTVHRLIDSGGFSRVYEATQHGLDRRVAIKVLNATFEDERQQRTFERECRVMGQLSTHPNIVTVFASAMTHDRRPCIVMELYEGTYRGEEQLTIAEVVDVGAKVADALQVIHDGEIVHRDIKPHNIFMSSHGQPAIADFGISSIESERTVTGAGGFSIDYAPPEVFEDGGSGAPGDIYSLGATLYQLAMAEVPYPHTGDPSERTRATVHKIIASPPPEVRRPDAPVELDRLIRRCMAKSADERPSSPAAVARELRRLQERVGRPDPARSLDRLRGQGPATTHEPTINRRGGDPRDSPPASTAIRQSGDGTSSVTVVRDRAAAPSETTDHDISATPAPRRQLSKRSIAAAVIGLAAVLGSALAIIVSGNGDGGETEAVATPTASTVARQPFIVLTAPENLTVDRVDEGRYLVSWSTDLEGVGFQVTRVGESERRVTDQTSIEWTVDSGTESACFEVRTLNAEQTRVSQTAAGPVCAGS